MKRVFSSMSRIWNCFWELSFLSNPDVRAAALALIVFLFGFLMGVLCLKAKLGIE